MSIILEADMAAPTPIIAGAAPLPSAASPQVHHRSRRMNFFDLANLLDSDGNLQNEMMVFAFAATMLSTIPILLGNEFDVNVGLRRKRRQAGPYRDPDLQESYSAYSSQDQTAPFFSGYTYKKLMTSPPGTDIFHIHNSTTRPQGDPSTSKFPQQSDQRREDLADLDLTSLLRELLVWSREKTKDKPLLPMLINLGLDRYNGNSNPADKMVKAAYLKWKKYWY